MQILMWVVFIIGGFASRYFFGTEGRLIYYVVVFVAIMLFRRQLAIGLTHVASKLGLIKGTIDRMPMSIKLVKATAIDEAARPVATELSAAGFVDAGAWDIVELPKIRVALMVHPSENFLAVIESASAIGAQLNVHTLYSTGNVVTFTNSRLPAPGAQRPGLSSERLPGASPRALLSKARAGRPGNGISAVTVEEAPRIYERLYTEHISYRKAHRA